MGAVVDLAFSEDIDLNAAAATIAAALSQRNCNLFDADTIQLPNEEGMWLAYIKHADETAGGLDGLLEFLGKGAERKFRFGQDVLKGDLLQGEIHFRPGQFPMPPGQKIKAYGGKSGSGAEQHTVILGVYIPSVEPVPQYTGPCKHIHMLGAMTGTLVANTISGLNTVLGDSTALADSEIVFGTAKKNKYVLIEIRGTPGGAGYGILGVRSPDGKYDRLLPATFAQAARASRLELNWAFDGTSQPRFVGCGVGTTSTELTMILGEIT